MTAPRMTDLGGEPAGQGTNPGGMTATRVVTLCLGVVIGASWFWLGSSDDTPLSVTALLLFTVAATVTELLPMRQPGGRAVPSSVAVIGAAAVLGVPPLELALVALAAWSLAQLIERGGDLFANALARGVGSWALAGVATLGQALLPWTWAGDVAAGQTPASVSVGAAIAVSLGIVVGPPTVQIVIRDTWRARFLARRLREAVLGSWLVGVAIAATAVLGALVHPVLGEWTLPTMLIPLFAARFGLARFAVAVRAYDQTVRAMSRLPEQLGTVEDDHGVRVGELAREVGLELGLDLATLGDLERAGYLHELGRISLEREVVGERDRDPAVTGTADVTPTDGIAATPSFSSERERLALAGAEVIEEAASLPRVAHIVEVHGRLGQLTPADDDVVLSARIVTACCEIDRYAPEPLHAGQRQEVVVRLVREVGDLDVVRALTRVLDRQPSDRASGRQPVG